MVTIPNPNKADGRPVILGSLSGEGVPTSSHPYPVANLPPATSYVDTLTNTSYALINGEWTVVGGAGSPDTATQVRDKLAGLEGDSRLPATAIKDLPEPGGGSGEGTRFTRVQPGHGIVAGTVVRSGPDGFVYAMANSAANVTRVMGVVESVTTDELVVVSSGKINTTGWGLAPDTTYLLSATSIGEMTATAPTGTSHYYLLILETDSDGQGFVKIGEPVALSKIPPGDIDLVALAEALEVAPALPDQVSSGEITAGTETEPRLWSPADVVAAIDEHAPEGGGTAEFTTGMAMLWATSDLANIPDGWIEAGDYGTAAQPSIGDWSVIVKSGGTVADPEFSVAAGEVEDDSTVELTCATVGASIRYTTDGSTPDRETGTLYSGPIEISEAVTIKAIAYRDGWVDSQVAEAAYTIAVPTAPSFVGAASRGTGATADWTVNYPTVEEDDILIAIFSTDSQHTLAGPPPSGWEQVGETTDGSSNTSMSAFWKRAGASEPDSEIWTGLFAASEEGIVVVVAYRGCITTGDPFETLEAFEGVGATSLYSKSITTVNANTRVVAIYATDPAADPMTFTWDAPATVRVDATTTPSGQRTTTGYVSVADFEQITPDTVTVTGTAGSSLAHVRALLALIPE